MGRYLSGGRSAGLGIPGKVRGCPEDMRSGDTGMPVNPVPVNPVPVNTVPVNTMPVSPCR